MPQAVIAGYARSPFTPAGKGALARVRPDHVAASVLRALVERSGVAPEMLEDIIMGCAFPEGEQGFNVARLVGLIAGLPRGVGGMTVNRFCGSSMSAVHIAAGQIAMGAGEAFLCGGIESMSRVPMGGFNPMPNPALKEATAAYIAMGDTAENVAREYQIGREEQEQFAVRSQRKAAAAMEAGKLADEIVPIEAGGAMVKADTTPRPDTDAATLAGLKTAFDERGTVTAGTASPLTDGCAAVLVTSAEHAAAHGLKVLAQIKAVSVSGCEPHVMGIGPVEASKKALERAGVTVGDLDVIELNEAFASQSIACIRDLGLDEGRVNIDGGAIALGHPLGATGARIVGKAAALLQREGGRYALATQCIGGGQGIATVLEAA